MPLNRVCEVSLPSWCLQIIVAQGRVRRHRHPAPFSARPILDALRQGATIAYIGRVLGRDTSEGRAHNFFFNGVAGQAAARLQQLLDFRGVASVCHLKAPGAATVNQQEFKNLIMRVDT